MITRDMGSDILKSVVLHPFQSCQRVSGDLTFQTGFTLKGVFMKKLALSFATLMFSLPSYGYYSVLTTGEILPQDQYTMTPEVQFMNDPDGVNVGAHFETGLTEGSGLRGEIGVGKVDVYLGGFYKFIPYPDIEGQPAVGFNTGVVYASDAGYSEFTLRFEPLVSKKFETNFGFLTPYGSVPVGFQHRTSGRDKNDVALQIVGGVEIGINQWNGLRLMPEFGIDLDNAPNYISLAAVLDFDAEGFKIAKGE